MTLAQQNTPAVGIDLGTTYSAIARLDEHGRPITIPNAEGELTTPSVILFEDGQIIVGREGLRSVGTAAERVAQFTKREIGDRLYHKAINARQYPPEVLQAIILAKLKHDAEQVIGPFTKAVVTVPAYFDEVRRKATQDAGYMAGIEVTDIINEPTAAAIAHGFQQGYLDQQAEEGKVRRVLVYDLGGGTFDVTVMEVDGHDFITLATDGDVQLGGCDWDQRIVDRTAEEFVNQFGIDPRQDANHAGQLWLQAEAAKRSLSSRAKTTVRFDAFGHSLLFEITRPEFEEWTGDLLERTRFTAKQTLQAAGLTWKDLHYVLLVGGSTRMLAVVNMLRELSGKEPDRSISVDEAVAHGAALHAGVCLARSAGEVGRVQITNVNSHSLGVVATDSATGRKRNAIVVPRNTKLPVLARRSFRTQVADQRSIYIQVVEGESASPDDCVQIGKCSVQNLPPGLKAQTPIDVHFEYREDGRLGVRVYVHGTGTELSHEFARNNTLSQKQLDAWRTQITRVFA
jgi:molecular chaperone DnaK